LKHMSEHYAQLLHKIPTFKNNVLKIRMVKRKSVFRYKAIHEFEEFYRHKYAQQTLIRHFTNLKKFIKYLAEVEKVPLLHFDMVDLSKITIQNITSYERYLVSEMYMHRISKATVTKYLRSVLLLLDLMNMKHLSKLRYSIPKSLMDQGNRSNIKATVEEISAILEALDNNSHYKERDLSIVLLTMELGCRPIELVGITIDDILWTESKVNLYCIKSGQRALKISKRLTQLLKKYKEIRETYQLSHPYFFVNQFGEPMSQNGVASIFGRANKKAFGERRINPKAMRHTYATNALDNLNDFDEVSRSMGHLHGVSTEYYVYKSISRLLKMSAPYNPSTEINIGGEPDGI
jgi:integrase